MKRSLRDEKAVLEVIDLCLSLEEKAEGVYESLREQSGEERMRRLFATMAADEREHQRYWVRLKDVCAAGAVPEVFEEPRKYADELRALVKRFDHIAETVKREHRAPEVFIHVLRMEFLLLHPSFMTLFHYLPDSPQQVSPHRTYERHLGRFLNILMDYQQLSPELELLGEAIGQLWKKSEEGTTRAVLDPLTGAFNRRGLYIAMKPLVFLARREKQRVGVLIFEVADLKRLNAEHGHQFGDDVLVAAAAAISSRLRGSDVVGRFGGDDFLALLTRFDERFFERIARDIMEQVGKLSIRHVRPTLLAGGASAVIGGDVPTGLEALIRAADNALTAARVGGGGCVVTGL